MNLSQLIKHPQALVSDLRVPVPSQSVLSEGRRHLSYANGVMTAVIAGPEDIGPREWISLIIDIDELGVDDDAAYVAASFFATEYERIESSLKGNSEAYVPEFFTDEHGQESATDWVDGFWSGVRLRPAAWAPLFNNDHARGCVAPMYLLTDGVDLQEHIEKSGLDRHELLVQLRQAIPECVHAMYDYWQNRLAMRKVGRNQPCPCGSGRKYKKCCLN